MPIREFEMKVDGIPSYCWETGRGRPLLLLHGSGPGAASQGTWKAVLDELAQDFHVFGCDMIGFGHSGRKSAPPFFDLDLWLRQAQALLAAIPGEQVGVIGHSLSGATALRLGGLEPRVQRVMTTGTMGTDFEPLPETGRPWVFPETREDLRRALSVITHAQAGISDAILDARMKVLHENDYAAYFRSMFAGDKRRYVTDAALTLDELARLRGRKLMFIHGIDDRIIPARESLRLQESLPHADVLLLGECGHLPATEQPQRFLAAVRGFFS